MIRNHKIFALLIEYDQEIREQVSQDESRLLGHQRHQRTLHIIAEAEEIALSWLKSGSRPYSYPNCKVLSVAPLGVNAFIESHTW